jgi:hypothetical protein
MYQDVAAQYIVKVLVGDQQLLTMYEDAIQKTEKAKFVKNNGKLLHRFFQDIRSEGQFPSEISAIRFMARKTRRELISSEIYDIVAPSNDSMRAKLQIRLDREHSTAYRVARWLADQDNADSTTLVVKSIEPEPPEYLEDSTSESDYESTEKDVLAKLESAAEFLVAGQPYQMYKENLQAFLHPVSSQTKPHHGLLLKKPSSQTTQRSIDKRQNDHADSSEAQQSKMNPREYLSQGASIAGSLIGKEPNPKPRLHQAQKTYTTPFTEIRYPTSLPMLVNSLVMYLPLPYSEPPVPVGKVRARWICVCFVHRTRIFNY